MKVKAEKIERLKDKKFDNRAGGRKMETKSQRSAGDRNNHDKAL